MPLYEYECKECGVRFDRIQHFHDEPITDCPECENGQGQVQRLIGPVGIVFKGPGFYANDSKRGKSSK
ncbi:MAG: zinc ribbon domain-containing protein [Anaerolineae bacterium]|nr:zinc ribbon domain-containing protein [Anaerolineae bacterium]